MLDPETALVDGTAIHHLDVGPRDGEPLLLIHGITATHRYWSRNVLHLARRRRVLALDLPGFGRSDKPDASYSIPYFVAMVARFLDGKGVARASVVGNSLGGHIAMAFALAHPARLHKLVLVDPAGVTALPTWILRVGLWAMANAPAGGAGLPSMIPRVPRPLLQALFRAVFPTRPDLAQHYVSAYHRAVSSEEYPLHLRSAFRAARGVVRSPMRGLVRQIAAPTLIVWGAKDYLLPVTAARGLRRAIPDARLIIYRESGHCPMVDQPERWNGDVEAFLDGRTVGR